MLVPHSIQTIIPQGFLLHRVERRGGGYGYTFRQDASSIHVMMENSEFAPPKPEVTQPRLVWSNDIDAQECYESTFQLGIEGTAVRGQCFAPSARAALHLVDQLARVISSPKG